MSMLFVQQKILRIGKLKLYVLFSTAKVNAAPNVVRDGDYAQLKLINTIHHISYFSLHA